MSLNFFKFDPESKKKIITYLPLVALAALMVAFSGCDSNTEDKLEDAAENVEDASEHAAEETEDAVEEAAEKTEEMAK